MRRKTSIAPSVAPSFSYSSMPRRSSSTSSAGGVALDVLALALEDLDERRPAPLALVERREARERVGIARREGEHLVPQRDGLAHVVEALAGDLRHLDERAAGARRLATCGSSRR